MPFHVEEVSPIKQSLPAKIAAKPFLLPPIAALFLCLLIEVLSRRSLAAALGFAAAHPLRFSVNFLLIALTYCIVLFTRRAIFAASLVTYFWLTLGVANCILMSFRGMPLTAEDFSILGDALSIMHVYVTPVMAILILVAFLAAITLALLLRKIAPPTSRSPLRALLCTAATALLLALSASAALSSEALASISVLDTTAQSEELGFALSFARTIFDRGVEEPLDYSPTEVDNALALIPTRKCTTEQPNLIFVQLESFFDITRIDGLDLAEDPIPHFRALAEANPSGALTVPTVGGGTANTEFELLTGISCTLFGPGEYPYSSILTERSSPSLANGLSTAGYRTHAIHNHTATFYNRSCVYANLGFDSFTSVEYMQNVERNSLGWAKDSMLTDEILSTLASTEERDLIFAVSVQCHGKYPDESTDLNESDESGKISIGLTDEETEAEYAYYLSQLREVDAFIGALYDALLAWDEPCVVVFYGDHLPALSIEEGALSGDRFDTEYVIAANFTLPDAPDNRLHAYELAAYTASLVGVDAGPIFRLQEAKLNGSLTEEECSRALSVLTYDLLCGSCYAEPAFAEEGIRLVPSPLLFGHREISISRVTGIDGNLTVEGKNFTESSKIVIDGMVFEATRYENGKLILDGRQVKDGSRIAVAQVADDGSVLGTTDSVEISAPASLPFSISRN